jgi:putative tributyrin esterase
MALLRCEFSSEVLKMSTSMTVILPHDRATPFSPDPAMIDPAPPVLYLLHGGGDDDTAWARQTAVERYVEPLGLVVVMPQAGRSFYTDQVHGQPYWTFLSEELPHLVQAMFRVSTDPADTFVAGLSMGGYGAMRWALTQPERFAAVASLSGVLDLPRVRGLREGHREPMMDASFGQAEVAGTEVDPLHLLAQAARSDRTLPRMFVGCGTRDALHDDNVRFVAAAAALGVAVESDFGPGAHEWAYWDSAIQRVLAWLPIRGR